MITLESHLEMATGRVASIPTLPRLFKTILIPVPFKKLNGAGQGGAGQGGAGQGMINSHTRPV